MNLSGLGTLAFLSAAVTVASTGQGTSRRYEIRMAMIGYTGLAESLDCKAMVDTLGYDSLVGTVQGVEGLKDEDGEPLDVVYKGRLRRATRIDYCLALPGDVGLCVVRLSGEAQMNVELKVYGETGRGAWLHADSVPGAFVSETVTGDCPLKQKEEVRAEYPSRQTAGSPDGQPIQEDESERPDPARLLALGGVRRLRIGFFPANKPETEWGLRIVRVLP